MSVLKTAWKPHVKKTSKEQFLIKALVGGDFSAANKQRKNYYRDGELFFDANYLKNKTTKIDLPLILER